MKEFLVNKINRNRPLRWSRTQWVDVIVQDIKNKKNKYSTFVNVYDKDKKRGFVIAAITRYAHIMVREADKDDGYYAAYLLSIELIINKIF